MVIDNPLFGVTSNKSYQLCQQWMFINNMSLGLYRNQTISYTSQPVTGPTCMLDHVDR